MQVEDKVKKARSPRNARQEQRIDVTPNIGDVKKVAHSDDQSGILDILGLGDGELSTVISSAVVCPQSRVKGVDIVDASHLAFVHHAKEAIQTGATTRFLHIIGGLLEDAVLVCLALNRCQRNVLIHKSDVSDALPSAGPLAEAHLETGSGFSGIVQSIVRSNNTIGAVAATHTYMINEILPNPEDHPVSDHGNVSITKNLLLASSDLLNCLAHRLNTLFEEGALSVTTACNASAMIEGFVADRIVGIDYEDYGLAVRHSLNLRAVASALRVHNHVCARLAVDMSYDLYQNALDDLPILNKDWSINNDAA